MKGKATRRVQERSSDSMSDTYLNQAQPKDHSYCKKCQAIYHHKHWTFNDAQLKKLKSNGSETVICPACQKIADRYASGIVTLKGQFIPDHREEILNLIHNEEKRAMGLNPLERIIEVTTQGMGYEVRTTHEKLAQRIGKKLHRAFSGTVAYQWVPQDKMARVRWVRD